VHDHVNGVLAATKWEPMRGLNCLRHSFIPNAEKVSMRKSCHGTEDTTRAFCRVYAQSECWMQQIARNLTDHCDGFLLEKTLRADGS
jgi:hypothetical protein